MKHEAATTKVRQEQRGIAAQVVWEILVVLGAVGVVLVLGLRGRSASGAPGGESALKREPEEDAEQPAAAVRPADPTSRCSVTCCSWARH